MIKKPKRVSRSQSTDSTDTVPALTQQSQLTRNESTASTSKNRTISIKQTKKKIQVYSFCIYLKKEVIHVI